MGDLLESGGLREVFPSNGQGGMLPCPNPSGKGNVVSKVLDVEKRDGVATLTLNRPDAMNALSAELRSALAGAFRDLQDDDRTRVVILTGAGRAFCAGLDLEELSDPAVADGSGKRDFGRGQSPVLAMAAFAGPIIGAINGHAIGVGVTMTLPCDIRIAADTAKLGLTFARLGILPGLGSTHLLVGEVLMYHLDDSIVVTDKRGDRVVDSTAMDAVCRLGTGDYARVLQTFSLGRPRTVPAQ